MEVNRMGETRCKVSIWQNITVSLLVQKFGALWINHLSIVSFNSWSNRGLFRKPVSIPTAQRVLLPMFHLEVSVLQVSHLSLCSMELVFLQSDKHWSNFILLRVNAQFSLHWFMKMLLFHIFVKYTILLHALMFGPCILLHWRKCFFFFFSSIFCYFLYFAHIICLEVWDGYSSKIAFALITVWEYFGYMGVFWGSIWIWGCVFFFIEEWDR